MNLLNLTTWEHTSAKFWVTHDLYSVNPSDVIHNSEFLNDTAKFQNKYHSIILKPLTM